MAPALPEFPLPALHKNFNTQRITSLAFRDEASYKDAHGRHTAIIAAGCEPSERSVQAYHEFGNDCQHVRVDESVFALFNIA